MMRRSDGENKGCSLFGGGGGYFVGLNCHFLSFHKSIQSCVIKNRYGIKCILQ